MNHKVKFFDENLRKMFWGHFSVFSTVFGMVVVFFDDALLKEKIYYPIGLVIISIIWYVVLWLYVSNWKKVDINIESTTISIITGDIFKQEGLKVIAFNEYFDTQVDDKVISKKSLNGIFIDTIVGSDLEKLDKHIKEYDFRDENILEKNTSRIAGKEQKYRIGTICVYDDYLLTAFSKFNERNQAYLTMPEYLEFLIKFWDEINVVYAQKSVSVTIFGSGITRIKEHRNISDEELLKIMLWTFRVSETRFKYPAKLTIVIHKDKIDQINLFEIKSMQNGI